MIYPDPVLALTAGRIIGPPMECHPGETASKVVMVPVKYSAKDDTIFTAQVACQVFYAEDGVPSWIVGCVQTVEHRSAVLKEIIGEGAIAARRPSQPERMPTPVPQAQDYCDSFLKCPSSGLNLPPRPTRMDLQHSIYETLFGDELFQSAQKMQEQPERYSPLDHPPEPFDLRPPDPPFGFAHTREAVGLSQQDVLYSHQTGQHLPRTRMHVDEVTEEGSIMPSSNPYLSDAPPTASAKKPEYDLGLQTTTDFLDSAQPRRYL